MYITGMGVVTAYGRGVASLYSGLMTGRPPTGTVDGTVPIASDGSSPARRLRQWYGSVVEQALREACWDRPLPLVLIAGQAASPPAVPVSPFLVPSDLGAGGPPRAVVSHACASGLFAVAAAKRLLDSGRTDAVLVVGATVLNPHACASMRVVKAVSDLPAAPFGWDRAGINVGEGAGAVLLQTRPEGASPVRVAGVATRLGGASATASDESHVAACILESMRAAGRTAVGHVHAHATGTGQGDAAEARALHTLAATGDGPVEVTSHKGALGHLLQACALPSLITAVATMRAGIMPGTVGITARQIDQSLALPDGEAISGISAKILSIRASGDNVAVDGSSALVNAFGFGGNNASVVLSAT